MDCSICSAMPYNLRPPRNTICVACYEGAKSIIAMTNKIDDHKVPGKLSGDVHGPSSSKIILTDDVTDVGKKGQLLDVKAGFYRNFLHPAGKARIVTPVLLKEMKMEEERIEAEKQRVKEEALQLAQIFETVGAFQVKRKGGKGKQIFGRKLRGHQMWRPELKPLMHQWMSGYSLQGFMSSLKWLKEMKKIEEEINQKLGFLSGFMGAYRDQLHTDILIKPGDDAPSIPAHRALLATRSNIFRNMLDSDACKSAPNDTITLHELNHGELESLLEFLYSGDLTKAKLEKHLYSLSMAADKYEIPFLQKFCENRMLETLSTNNALDVLEIADTICNHTLKETALSFVVKNMEDIVFASRFDVFALKNPHLTVQITRASFLEIKNRRSDS